MLGKDCGLGSEFPIPSGAGVAKGEAGWGAAAGKAEGPIDDAAEGAAIEIMLQLGHFTFLPLAKASSGTRSVWEQPGQGIVMKFDIEHQRREYPEKDQGDLDILSQAGRARNTPRLRRMC